MVTNEHSVWRDKLSDEAYHVCWEKGTEAPFSGTLLHNRQSGDYLCICCGNVLFDSEHKFDSGCGWPSFDAARPGAVRYERDRSHGMVRTEILCNECGAHLGHVFDDGPTPSGLRYCVNSVAMQFNQKEP